MFHITKKNFMAPFYGWGSTVSRLQSHYEETVYFVPLSPREFLALSFDRLRKDESLNWPWSHPVVLNLRLLDWESSPLTTRPLLNHNEICMFWCYNGCLSSILFIAALIVLRSGLLLNSFFALMHANSNSRWSWEYV